VRVIKRGPLVEFGRRWPAAAAPLDFWYRIASKAQWRNFAEVKQAFGQTDLTKVSSGNTVAIFDIGGNKFRLIARISYEKSKVYVLRVLTHKEYDANKWKAEL
jgi:mRNA interferase HigB